MVPGLEENWGKVKDDWVAGLTWIESVLKGREEVVTWKSWM